MRQLQAHFIEFQEVLKAKGVQMEIQEVMQALDYNEHEQANEFFYQRMVDKMEYERALNHYNGLANAVKVVMDQMEVA